MNQTNKDSNKRFDPLLFDGFDDRKWNHRIYAILMIGFFMGLLCGFYILNGLFVEDWHNYAWFSISYAVIMSFFIFYCIIWIYVHFLLFKNGRANKHINKSNPLLICEYEGSFKNYFVWALGFLTMFILYFIILILSIFAPPFLLLF